MLKKFILICLILLSLLLSGCADYNRIDTASLVRCVTAEYNFGKTAYNFYLLDNSEDVNCVSVKAENFEKATALAREKYIPMLSFSKLELFLVDGRLGEKTLADDVKYMANKSRISPLVMTAFCSSDTLQLFSKDKDALKKVKEHIMLIKKNNSSVSTTSLSIFNNFRCKTKSYFSICYIVSDKELKAESVKISLKK